jgi:hypothetical protein
MGQAKAAQRSPPSALADACGERGRGPYRIECVLLNSPAFDTIERVN